MVNRRPHTWFIRAASKHFRFLKARGFLEKPLEWPQMQAVAFVGPKVSVVSVRDEIDGYCRSVISATLGRVPELTLSEIEMTLVDLLRLKGVAVKPGQVDGTVTPATAADLLSRQAEYLRHYGDDILSGSLTDFERFTRAVPRD